MVINITTRSILCVFMSSRSERRNATLIRVRYRAVTRRLTFVRRLIGENNEVPDTVPRTELDRSLDDGRVGVTDGDFVYAVFIALRFPG